MDTKIGKLFPKDILIIVFLLTLAITGFFNMKTNLQIMESDSKRMALGKKILSESAKNVVIMNSLLKNDSVRIASITQHRKTTDSLIVVSMQQNKEILRVQGQILLTLKELKSKY